MSWLIRYPDAGIVACRFENDERGLAFFEHGDELFEAVRVVIELAVNGIGMDVNIDFCFTYVNSDKGFLFCIGIHDKVPSLYASSYGSGDCSGL